MAARLPGTLAEVEAVVDHTEQSDSQEGACSDLRLDIELPGVLRWVRRRVQAIQRLLVTLKGLMPERFGGCAPRLSAFAECLGTDEVLVPLREIAAPYLPFLPAPLGFCPRRLRGAEQVRVHQQRGGPDPPALFA